jgi:hypothetical protein
MLEAMDNAENSFVTLTYENSEIRSLDSGDARDWLKRFRKFLSPRRIRYFLVGEYGDQAGRPHYHAALFGYGSCTGGLTIGGACQCQQCLGVRETWKLGHVLVGTLEPRSAAYIAGYVTKKLDAPALKADQVAPFARMSLRPGIGANAMWDVASEMMRYELDTSIPSVLEVGRSPLPLGRYLRNKIREFTGQWTAGAELEELEAELLAVRQVAWNDGKSVKEVYALLNEGYARSLNARLLLKEKKL